MRCPHEVELNNLEVIVYVRPPQGKTTMKVNKETGGLERQTALEDSSAGQEQDNKWAAGDLADYQGQTDDVGGLTVSAQQGLLTGDLEPQTVDSQTTDWEPGVDVS